MANETERDIAEVREALAVAANDIASLGRQIESLAAAVSRLQSVPQPGILAYWGPALASAIALAGLATFILDERVTPIVGDVRTATRDIRDLSGLVGEVKRENVSQEERLKFQQTWLGSVQDATTRNREKLHELERR